MPGPVLRDPTPAWIRDPSVMDPAWQQTLAKVARFLGLDTAEGQALAVMNPMETGPAGGLVGLLGDLGRGLYSRVDEVVARMKGTAHPNKIAAQLKNLASPEEVAYRRLPEFLASKGDTPVTKTDLQAHLAAHPAPFPQTTTLRNAPEELIKAQDALSREADIYRRAAFDDPADWVGVDRLDQMNARHWAYQAAGGDAEALRKLERVVVDPDHLQTVLHYGDLANQSRVLNERRLAEFPAPKYERYTLPGGESYRESLYTLTPKPPDQSVANAAIKRMEAELQHLYAQAEATRGRDMNIYAAIEQKQHDIRAAYRAIPDAGTFHSGHFDQPNIVAHARTTERTLPTGERGRFLEEVQSDWHQAGKKKGYGPTREYTAFYRTPDGQQVPLGFGATEAEARATVAPQWNGLVNVEVESRLAPSLGVPDAPFKESWPDLTLKQQLLEAAQDPNAAWLGFTSGQTQAARYDLSKQISRVHYDPDTHYLEAFDRSGDRVIRREHVTPKDLPDLIGKEPADKLLQQPRTADPTPMSMDDTRYHILSGVDLQVGGEGMRHFYDELLPKRLEKIVKPFGGKVERSTVDVLPTGAIRQNNPALENAPAWIVRLTPEMKQRILQEGLPLMTIPLAALGGAAQERR